MIIAVVQLLSHVRLFVTLWTAACHVSLSFTISWNFLKLMFIEPMMPSNHLILCRPLLFLPSIFPSIMVFSWCEELTHWNRLWCWEELKAGEEGDDRGWDGWMASPTHMSLSKLWKMAKDREAWHAEVHGVHGVPKSWSLLSEQQWLFASGGQSTGTSASASVLPMNTQDWSPLGWTGWISVQPKWLSRIFSNTTVQKHQFFGAQFSL